MFLNSKRSISLPRGSILYPLSFLALFLLSCLFVPIAAGRDYDHTSQDDLNALVQDVLSKKVAIDQTTDDGMTALMAAVYNGDSQVAGTNVTNLINLGVKLNEIDNDGATALIHACLAGNLDVVKILLENNADPNKVDRMGWSALMYAAYYGHQEVVEIFLKHNADPRQEANNGLTTRAAALEGRHFAIADLLREQGVPATLHQLVIAANLILYLEKFSSRTSDFIQSFREHKGFCGGLTNLWLYAKWLDTIQPENYREYNSCWFKQTMQAIAEWDGNSKEHFSDFEKFIDIVDKLQSGDAQVDLEKCLSLCGLYMDKKILRRKYTIASTFTEEQLRDLLREIIIYDDELIRVLYWDNGPGHVVGLFKHGDNYYYYDSNNHCGEIRVSTINDLAQKIFNSNSNNNSTLGFIVSGFNEEFHLYTDQRNFLTKINPLVDSDALVISAHIRCFNSLKFFLDTGHDPNKTNAVGRTALYEASRLGYNDAVDLLLEKKANPNIKSKDVLDTALKASLVNEHAEIAIKLLDAGADPNEIGPYGFTALMAAVHIGDLKLIEKLFEKNVNLDTKNEGSQTALMIAAEEGKAEILKKLLEKNPDTKIADLQGHDVLYIADDSGHPDCAALLKEHQKKMLGAAGTK